MAKGRDGSIHVGKHLFPIQRHHRVILIDDRPLSSTGESSVPLSLVSVVGCPVMRSSSCPTKEQDPGDGTERKNASHASGSPSDRLPLWLPPTPSVSRASQFVPQLDFSWVVVTLSESTFGLPSILGETPEIPEESRLLHGYSVGSHSRGLLHRFAWFAISDSHMRVCLHRER